MAFVLRESLRVCELTVVLLFLLVAFTLFFCCMPAGRFAGKALLRLPGTATAIPSKSHYSPRLPLRAQPRRSSAYYRPYTSNEMLKRAVDTHHASTSHQKKPLSHTLFPSSSPDHQPLPASNRTPMTASSNGLRPNPSSSINGFLNSKPRTNPFVSGVKRTSSGLAKTLSSHSTFEEVENAPVKSTAPQVTRSEYFDEGDFDSDIDLDIEDPTTKSSVTYPILPKAPASPAKPTFYPTLQRQQIQTWRTTTPADSGYGTAEPPVPDSSAPLPWSSSPAEHFQAHPQKVDLKQYTHNGVPTQRLPAKKIGSGAPEARPTKRRTLPWLDQETQMLQNGPPLPSETVASASSRAHGGTPSSAYPTPAYTPLPKDNKRSTYPWNTTASAVKEQQKQLREINKKKVKNNEGTEHLVQKAKTNSRKVARVFLSEEQQHVLDLVSEGKKSVFFTGSAGTGKSVLLREIISTLRRKYTREPDRVAVTASTGLAACNIGGVTLHSFAGIGLGKEDVPELVKKIKRNQKAKHRWMRTRVLVIDEISMVDGELFDKLEAIARQLRNNGRPFGGIQLVITGDFFQLPPVPDYGKVAKFAFDAASWNTTIDHTIGLHHVFRQKDPGQ